MDKKRTPKRTPIFLTACIKAFGGLIVLAVGLGIFIFWVWALIDILKSDFRDSINKLI